MKKKVLSVALAAVLGAGLLAGCGAKQTGGDAAQNSSEAVSSEAKTGEANAPADGDNVIKIAATAVPHAELLEQVKPILAEQGYDLQIEVFDDYVQPNNVVESGDFDANYFQHIPYLDDFNANNKTHLVNAGGIHYEPFGIYPGTKSDLTDLEGATIAVPNDNTNEARALLLLQDNGIIKLADGVGLEATKLDIVENAHNIELVELEAAQIPRMLQDVNFAVMNGNYAMEAGFSVANDALAYESVESEAAATYVNVIAVKEGNENLPKIQALVEALKSDDIQNFIVETYKGGVISYK